MVKKSLLATMLCLAGTLTFTACHDDVGFEGEKNGTGSILPQVELNASVESSQNVKGRSNADAISASDLTLIIKDDMGQEVVNCPVDSYDPETKFKVGTYTVEAVYGDVTKEGFECPAYFGTQTVEVMEQQTSTVSLTASLANSMHTVKYTDDFKNYMTEWDASLHADGGQFVYYAQNETRPAYTQPGRVTLNVSFTTPSGKSASLNVGNYDALARHHYTTTVDLNKGTGSGDAVLIISFDDALDQEVITVSLNDELFNAPAPTIAGAGELTQGRVFSHIIGDEWVTPLKTNIIARGNIASIVVTTHSQSLIQQGWPAEVDLMAADQVMQARLAQLGFNAVGVYKNPGTMAVLDFTDVINHLSEAQDVSNNFSITVTDRMGKTVDEPFQFAVNTVPMVLTVGNPASLYVGANTFSFDLTFNGQSPEKAVSYQCSNERGTWTPLTTKSVEATATQGVYRVTVECPADAKPLTLRAATKVKNSDAITVNRVSPEFTIAANEADVWATKATLTLTCNDVDAEVLAQCATVYLAGADGVFNAYAATVNGNELTLTGLTAGTKYTAKVSVLADPDQACTPVSFTTEATNQVPNGDFEDLAQTLSVSGQHQGGQWSISAGINYWNTQAYTISEPTGWASVNKKTTSSTTDNSWFKVPSTFNTTLSFTSTCPGVRIFGGGGSSTPASYTGFTAASGSNAMVVRNVAWDPAGDVPGTWKKEYASSTEYYNHNAANTSRTSAGKLFLGSYDYSNGTETYTEGVNFATRPARLTGVYKYTCDTQDTGEKGTVRVELLNGSTVIGSGSATLAANTAMAAFEVPITYQAKAPKATSLRIMITSSDKANENAIKVTTYMSKYENYKHGATLVVDNLKFVY